ncbi:MAG TPA: hypothetical protein VHP31_01240, partial [Caproicibacter sp.]|nr:hypothetical protein [Caproicibacter sp.]
DYSGVKNKEANCCTPASSEDEEGKAKQQQRVERCESKDDDCHEACCGEERACEEDSDGNDQGDGCYEEDDYG